MAESKFKIDIDEGKVEIGGEWFDVSGLKKTIKKKVDKGDFDIAEYAEGLKELEEALKNTKEFHIKLPMEIADYVEARAAEEDTTPGAIIRSILRSHVEGGGEYEKPSEMEAEEVGEDEDIDAMAEPETEEPEVKESLEGEEKVREKPKTKPVKVKCPRCGTMILVTNPTRPLTITCPNCGERGVLTK